MGNGMKSEHGWGMGCSFKQGRRGCLTEEVKPEQELEVDPRSDGTKNKCKGPGVRESLT